MLAILGAVNYSTSLKVKIQTEQLSKSSPGNNPPSPPNYKRGTTAAVEEKLALAAVTLQLIFLHLLTAPR